MRRVEVVEPGGIREGREHWPCGSVVECDDVDSQIVNRWIVAGWARDLETGEMRERNPGAVKVQPMNVQMSMAAR